MIVTSLWLEVLIISCCCWLQSRIITIATSLWLKSLHLLSCCCCLQSRIIIMIVTSLWLEVLIISCCCWLQSRIITIATSLWLEVAPYDRHLVMLQLVAMSLGNWQALGKRPYISRINRVLSLKFSLLKLFPPLMGLYSF